MEIIARCDLTGEEEVLVLSDDATLGALRQHAGAAFELCLDEMELMADGLPLQGDDDDLLGTAELEGGAVLRVKRTNRPYLKMLREGKTLKLAPHWVWGDSECVLHAVQMSGNQLQHATPELRDTDYIVLAAVAETPKSLQYASHRLRSDKDFVLRVLNSCQRHHLHSMAPYICEEAHADREVVRLLGTVEYAPALRDDRDLLLQILHDGSGGGLRYASERLRGDRELAMLDRHSYSYLTPELRNDREVYLSQWDNDMGFAGSDVQGDRECALRGLWWSADVFTHLSAALRSDPVFVQEAVAVNGNTLQYVSPELRADKATVLKAVSSSRYALKHASPELQDDDEVVRVAVTVSGSLGNASPRLQQDADLIVACFAMRNCDGECLLPRRADREVVMRAVTANSIAFRYASEDLRRDREVVLQAITGMQPNRDVSVLKYTPYNSDKEVVLQAVARRSTEIMHASRTLQGDHDVLRAAALGMLEVLNGFPSSPALSDKAFVLELCALRGRMLQAVDPHLRMDRDVVEAAVRQDPASLWHATLFWDDEEMLLECIHDERTVNLIAPELWSDRHFVSRAVARNPRALEFASEALRDDEDLVIAALQTDSSAFPPRVAAAAQQQQCRGRVDPRVHPQGGGKTNAWCRPSSGRTATSYPGLLNATPMSWSLQAKPCVTMRIW